MKAQGKVVSVSRDWQTRKLHITFELDQFVSDDIDKILNISDLDITATMHKSIRSRSANNYFHLLSSKIADARTLRGDVISKTAEKNELIAKYGQPERIENDLAVYKTNAPPEIIKELEEPHFKFLKRGEDGAYWYLWFRPSRTYNTQEMSVLIDGAIEDAKEWGVETITPAERAAMLRAWGRYVEEHRNRS